MTATAWAPYVMRRQPRVEMLSVHSGRIAVTRWGPGAAAPVVMLHGMLDCAASYQFLADCLPDDWDLAAIDWRGYGHSDDRADFYWLPDNLADLEVLLDRLTPNEPARVIGHSLGGTVATTYAGVRPERLAWLINIEGFGMAPRPNTTGAVRLRHWLDEVRRLATPKVYASLQELADRIARRHPRLPIDRAHYLAWAWAREVAGGYAIAADPKHRLLTPLRLQRPEMYECWEQIRCPMLMLLGEQSEFLARVGGDAEMARWHTMIPGLQVATIARAGHMVPHEQPEALANEIMRFVRELR